MLINLSIASLITSSISNSPFFSSNNQYFIKLCQFRKFIPIVFYQTPKLDVQNSYFSNLLSNIIYTHNEDSVNQIIEDFDDIAGNSSFLQCSFINIQSGSAVISQESGISFIECLFYDITGGSQNSLFSLDSNKITISGCCFSDIKSSNSVFSLWYFISNLNCIALFDFNIITDIQVYAGSFAVSYIDFNCKFCNFTSCQYSQYIIDFQAESANFSDFQMTNNKVESLIYSINKQSINININSLFCLGNTLIKTQATYRIFNIYSRDLYVLIENSVFGNFMNEDPTETQWTHNLYLFAPQSNVLRTGNIQVLNCLVQGDLMEIGKFYYPQPISSFYTNNSQYRAVATTPVPMNSYLYENYRKECNIYLYPTDVFTKSNPFTASSAFTESNTLVVPTRTPSLSQTPSRSPTATPSISPSNKFTASSSFTASSPFTNSKSFTASKPFTASNIITPTKPFTPSRKFTASSTFPYIPTPSVNAVYGIVGAVGTAVVSFGFASLIWLSIRRCCIYDHNNFLHIDV